MSDWVVVTGDMVMFDAVFGNRTVVIPKPPVINGTGTATISNKKICVEGDEKKVVLSGVPYTTASHTVPGTGVITITALDASQKAVKVSSGQSVIIKGQQFKAQFIPTQPAKMPPPLATPDPPAPTMGSGSFSTSQQCVKAG